MVFNIGNYPFTSYLSYIYMIKYMYIKSIENLKNKDIFFILVILYYFVAFSNAVLIIDDTYCFTYTKRALSSVFFASI